MFETVVPEQFVKRNRKPLYEALPLSLAVHGLIGVALIAVNIWEIEFPLESPAQSIAFNLAETPVPPPPPPPPPKVQPTERVVVRKVEMPEEIVAPTVIPDEIPEVLPAAIIVEEVEGAVISGVEGGIAGGDVGGVIGGLMNSVIVPQAADVPNRVVVERDKPLGLYPLSQVYPKYPEDARIRAWEDSLVVRYVIGKDGRVKEVTVIAPPEREEFLKPTLRAIRSWRFKPLIKDGQRQEVVHELTVFYKLTSS